MNKLFVAAAIATGFFFLASADVQAQPRPAYRQNFTKPVPRPLPVVRVPYVSPYNSVAPYSNWSAPSYSYPYVTPAYTYPSYYQSTYPNYYQPTYPSYYQNAYPSYNSYYNPYTYPGIYTPGVYFGLPF